MKRLMAMVLSAALLLCMSVQTAFALEDIQVGEHFFVTDFEDRKGNPIDDEYWDSGSYTVRATYSKGKQYVDQPTIDSDGSVSIRVKISTSITSSQEVKGVVTITDIDTKDRYTADVNFKILTPQQVYIREVDHKEFELPDNSYHTNRVRFRDADSKNDIGTLHAEFVGYDDYEVRAYFNVRIAEQPTLWLSHNQDSVLEIVRKYEDADLRFITWDATPKFDQTGTLGIVMEKGEYLYSRGADNKLTAINGTYNSDRGTFDFKTNTLGAYVISDMKLSGAGTAASTASSAAPAPSSTAPAPAPSSTAPAPSSSKAPASSSSLPETGSESASSEEVSSEPEESSSEPEPEPEPSSSEPESSSTAAKPEKDEDDSSFPILPVAIGVGVVAVIGVAAFFVINGKKNSGKHYDSWDD